MHSPHFFAKDIRNDGSRTHTSNNFHYNTRLKNKLIRINNPKVAKLPESIKIFENFFDSNQIKIYNLKTYN